LRILWLLPNTCKQNLILNIVAIFEHNGFLKKYEFEICDYVSQLHIILPDSFICINRYAPTWAACTVMSA